MHLIKVSFIFNFKLALSFKNRFVIYKLFLMNIFKKIHNYNPIKYHSKTKKLQKGSSLLKVPLTN